MSNQAETKLLKLFTFSSGDSHYFEVLKTNFWDSDNIIMKKYKFIKNEGNANEVLIEKASKTLLNYKLKSEYFRYLMFEYTLIQPSNLSQLNENYYSIIFPYYLFLLRNEINEELYYLIIDNINFSINIYEKINLKNSFEINAISDIYFNGNCIEIEIVNSKEKVQIIPYIINQNELIYALIIYMAIIKKKEDMKKKELKKVNEINQNLKKTGIKTIDEKNIGKNYLFNKMDISKFKILSNDSLVPKGIIISTYISFEYNKNTLDKYILLGRRYIYQFKDETLKELNTIIPLTAGFTIIDFEDNIQKIRIKAGNKDYIFYIAKKEIYNSFKEKLIDIMEGSEEKIFEENDLIKCSINFYNDKNKEGLFENTPIYEKKKNDIEKLNNKLNELKNIKNEIEKESQLKEIIRQKISEEEN